MSEFIEKYPHEAGFAAHYAREIAPLLDKAEALRKLCLKAYNFVWITGIATLILMAVFMTFSGNKNTDTSSNDYSGYILLMVAAIIGIILGLIYGFYVGKNKKLLMPLITRFFEGINFDTSTSLQEETVKSFNILPDFDTYIGDDQITLPGQFTSCELNLRRTKKYSSNKSVVVFTGLAVLIDLPRAVTAPITVRPDSGKIGNWLTAKLKPYGEKISLEDRTFNKLFEIYSPDQVEARRVLQPALMRRLLQLSNLITNWGQDLAVLPDSSDPCELLTYDKAAHTKPTFSMAIKGAQVLIIVPCSRDMFETGSLFTSAYNTDEIRCTLYQIYLLLLINKELRQFPQMVS
jgi:hypothetical protein